MLSLQSSSGTIRGAKSGPNHFQSSRGTTRAADSGHGLGCMVVFCYSDWLYFVIVIVHTVVIDCPYCCKWLEYCCKWLECSSSLIVHTVVVRV